MSPAVRRPPLRPECYVGRRGCASILGGALNRLPATSSPAADFQRIGEKRKSRDDTERVLAPGNLYVEEMPIAN